MTESMTSGVLTPFTQPLPLAGERRKSEASFEFLSPLGERLGEGASR